MSLYEKAHPKLVSALGGVGLGTSIVYFIGVALVFAPGWRAWEQFFAVWGPPMVFVPGALLIAHLYLRTHLGGWWVDRGFYDEAVDYTEERLEPGIFRGRKETLYHRIYLARAHIGRAEYDAALERLTSGYSIPDEGREAAVIRGWQLEVALRLEDGDVVDEAYEAGLAADPPKEWRTRLEAGRAEWAVLEGSREAYHTHIGRAEDASDTHWRVRLARGFAAVRFGRSDDAYEEGEADLAVSREEAVREVPARAAEIDAVRAQLLERLGRGEEADEMLASAEEVRADARSQRRVSHVSDQLEDAESQST